MSEITLEDELVAELQTLFEGMQLQTPDGQLAQIQVFKYDLPAFLAGQTPVQEPFIAVCPTTGQISERGASPETDIGLGIRIYNTPEMMIL